MIKEFFKSTFRTLGRIFAYVLLGILAYFILSWFGLDGVKAETYDFNYFLFQSIQQNGSTNDYMGTYVNADAYGYNAYPYKEGEGFSGIKSGSYNVTFGFKITYSNLNYYQLPLKLYFNDYNSDTLATCDGNESYIMLDRQVVGNLNSVIWQYNCSQLNVNRDFPRVRFNVFSSSYPSSFGVMKSFTFGTFSFVDLSDPNASVIINQNINSQNEINKMQEINQNMYDGFNNVNGNLQNIDDTLTDSSVSSPSSPLSTINQNIASTNGIQTIFLLPVTLIQTILVSLSSNSCSNINLGSLYGTNLTLTCINLPNILGNDLYNLIDLICCFGIIFGLRKYILTIWHKITSLKEDNLND